MIDEKVEQWAAEEAMWADFEPALAQKKWADCRAMIENAGNDGYESLAIRMNKAYNDAHSIFPKDDAQFLKELAESGYDPRDEADRNYP